MRKILNYFQNRSLKKANIVIPNSQELIEKAVTWGIEKQKITPPVYNGVDTQMFKPLKVERNEKFTIAYAGRISPEKRVLRLLKVTEKMTDICFMIAGKKQMNISFPSSVEYLGELPFSEMPEFYNKADLIVLPSVTEGFPNVLLEAYACGKPVLVAKEAFPNELKIFGAIGILDEFELKIKTLIRSDLADLGRQARAYVMEHYSWERFGKLIVDQLENLVSLNND
jgi:glycosyltransferase involved in cell wall biosynthesis